MGRFRGRESHPDSLASGQACYDSSDADDEGVYSPDWAIPSHQKCQGIAAPAKKTRTWEVRQDWAVESQTRSPYCRLSAWGEWNCDQHEVEVVRPAAENRRIADGRARVILDLGKGLAYH